MLLRKLGLGIAGMTIASAALAGATNDALERFQAIASGDVAKIMDAYSSDARLHWVGGPLNGTYGDPGQIRAVWTKFSKNNAPARLKTGNVEESANPAGSTVTANVVFESGKEIKVRYVLVYRDGKVVDEVWQIDPNMMH